jgi:hypothetical protein
MISIDDPKVVKRVLTVQRRFSSKGKRFYLKRLKKDFGERIEPLLGDGVTIDDLIQFYTNPNDNIERKLEEIVNRFFKVSKHAEAKILIREIDTTQFRYALNELPPDDKRLLLKATKIGLDNYNSEK